MKKPEWLLQAAMIAEFNRLEDAGWQLSAVGDMNAGRRSWAVAAQSKAMGMKAGEPDVRVYFSGGKTVFVEVKTKTGRVSTDQFGRHGTLRRLGFDVETVWLFDEEEARSHALRIAKEYGAAPIRVSTP